MAKEQEKAERDAARKAEAERKAQARAGQPDSPIGLRSGTALAVDAAGAAFPLPETQAGTAALPTAAPAAQGAATRRWMPYVWIVFAWGAAGYFLNTGSAIYYGAGTAALYGLACGALAGLGLALALRSSGNKMPLVLGGSLALTWGIAWGIGSFITHDGSPAMDFLGSSKYPGLILLNLLFFGLLPGLASGWLLGRFSLVLSRRTITWIGVGWTLAAWLGGMKYIGDLLQGYQEGDYSFFTGFADGILVGVTGLVATRSVLARAGQETSGWKRPDFERWLLALGTGLLWLGFMPLQGAWSGGEFDARQPVPGAGDRFWLAAGNGAAAGGKS